MKTKIVREQPYGSTCWGLVYNEEKKFWEIVTPLCFSKLEAIIELYKYKKKQKNFKKRKGVDRR